MFGNVFNMSMMSFPAFLPTAQNLLTVKSPERLLWTLFSSVYFSKYLLVFSLNQVLIILL